MVPLLLEELLGYSRRNRQWKWLLDFPARRLAPDYPLLLESFQPLGQGAFLRLNRDDLAHRHSPVSLSTSSCNFRA
jgi:hypothetical protein